uniref:Histone-binding protein RBBP4 N-terminal domain-containing protein n=1 Tax=Chlamydomonas euryale TaxID=1486919 RepID=A0A7R9Z3I7_9CHLO|mmetsp:Transcript_42310/g.126830  ORF Transcript_42310/g.126830 Transcript_42310/m.126830 type:complete len:375 (+) Transcript_42310:112-1236(+)
MGGAGGGSGTEGCIGASGGDGGSGGGGGGPGTCPELSPRVRFAGHAYTVEDVVFKPDSCNVLASVGDDHMIAFWDVRTPRAPTSCVCDAHGRNQDIQVVDWCGLDGLSVATGAMDGSLKVWDVRRMSRPCDAVAAFSGQHAGGIIRIEWHPQERGVLASGGEDRLVNVWRVPTATQPAPNGSGGGRGGRGGAAGCGGAALLFQHIGHHRGKVMDFQWCNGEGDAASWTMLSASDDADDEDISGGSLQVWRMSPLIHLHEDAAVELLRPHQDFILGQSAGSGDGDDGGGPGAAASEHPAQPSVKQEDSSSLRRMATAAAETGRPGGSNAASEGSGAGAGAGGGQTERLPLVRSSGPLRARVGGADPRDETCMHDS